MQSLVARESLIHMFNFLDSTMPVDGLALLGARPSAGRVMTKCGFLVYWTSTCIAKYTHIVMQGRSHSTQIYFQWKCYNKVNFHHGHPIVHLPLWDKVCLCKFIVWLYPSNEVRGYIGISQSICPSVCLSIHEHLCPFCSTYSSGWILSIFGTNDQ